jgi:glycosyltransferase involved in cell wall biosynthesis
LRFLALIPALDAADTVGWIVEGARKHIPDVLVVDDGSSDDTAKKAEEAGAAVVRHPKNAGKGAALRTGFGYALANGYDAVITLDADGQHDPDEIPKLVDKLKDGAGIVIGARLRDKDSIPPARYYTNRLGVACYSWRSKSRLEDSQSGFRVYRAEVLRGMKYTSSRFEAESEFLVRAGRRGFRIDSVPVRTIYNEDVLQRSHYRPVADTYRICILFLKTFFWFRP